MKDSKLATISNLFEGIEIRSIWDSEKEEYYFSVVDVVKALTDSSNPRNYWNMLKKRMTEEEKSELSTKCVRLKMKASDGKFRGTDTLDTKGIFRLIESIPSPKAEPFKVWLANLGSERVDEVFDPEKAVKRAVHYYKMRGYDDEWIKLRLAGIVDRNRLTDVWIGSGIHEDYEFGILTNEIYQGWSGMKASEYKEFKGIRKESLRDNMSDLEILLTDIGEVTTRELAKEHKPYGLEDNKKIAASGGEIANITRKEIESRLGKSVVNNENKLSYRYKDENKKLRNK